MMKKQIRIALFGGDTRQIFLAKRLVEDGFLLQIWGLGEPADERLAGLVFHDWKEALAGADVLMLPLPVSTDGVRLNTPLQGEASLRLSLLAERFCGKLVLGGRIPPALRGLFEERAILCEDYYESEILQLKNALPTAEGAIFVAMGELPVTLDGCRTAVVGYGRIGSLLAEKLAALGADVTVLARRRESLETAALRRHRGLFLDSTAPLFGLQALPQDLRVIFNTVPSRIFTKEALERVPQGCLFIDLASAPGGIDFSAAEEKGIRTIWATALPGKYSPETAGIILAQTAEAMLETLEQYNDFP